MFKFMKKLSKYFDSEWSFAKFRVTDSRTLCTFDKDAKYANDNWKDEDSE